MRISVEGIEFAETLYEVLGVPEDASAAEIKHAYYELIRRFPAHRNEELFMRLNDAGTILMDPRRRGEYDQSRKSGKRMQILVDQAAVALERDNQKAISLLKSAIVMAPDVPRPRHLLAHVLMKAEEFTLAENQYRWLVKESPRDETLRFRLSRALYSQRRLADAEKQLLRAMQLNPRYHDALMLLSQIYEEAERFDAARDALERAIANDERENLNDLDAMIRLLVLQIRGDVEADREPIIRRILGVLSVEDAPENAAMRGASKLLARAEDFFKQRLYPVALGLLEAAGRITDADQETKDAITALRRRVILAAETQEAAADPLLSPALKDAFTLRFLDSSGESQRERRMESVLISLQAEIMNDAKAFLNAVEYVRREYPEITLDLSGLLSELASRATKRIELLSPTQGPGAPTVMPGSTAIPEPPKKRAGWMDRFRKKG